jgi:aspartyl-tRNA(Asn)/glutamyl-tRNA(Gln) amidotransferase subunit A
VREVERHLEIARSLSNTNSFVNIHEKDAIAAAEASEARFREGKPLGLLDGAPFTVKSNYCVEGYVTSASSQMLQHYTAPYTATVIDNLQKEGAILLGQVAMDAMGMGAAGIYNDDVRGRERGRGGEAEAEAEAERVVRRWSQTRNSWVAAGGSSSGGAVSLHGGCGLWSVASDTGGSSRLPASWSGTLLGYKPSYGQLSRHGLIPYASSLDTVGILGGEGLLAANDIGIILSAMRGTHPDSAHDMTHTPQRQPQHQPQEGVGEVGDSVTIRSVPLLWEALHLPQPPSLPPHLPITPLPLPLQQQLLTSLAQALPTYHILATVEAASNLNRYDGWTGHGRVRISDADTISSSSGTSGTTSTTGLKHPSALIRQHLFSQRVRQVLLAGVFASSSEYAGEYVEKARCVRRRLLEEWERILPRNQVLLLPAAIEQEAPLLERVMGMGMGRNGNDGNHDSDSDSDDSDDVSQKNHQEVVDDFLRDILNVPANLSGRPSIVLPLEIGQEEEEEEKEKEIGKGKKKKKKKSIMIQCLGWQGGDIALLETVQGIQNAVQDARK